MRKDIAKRLFSSTQQTAQGALPQMPNMTHVRRFYKKVEVVEHPLSSQLEKLSTDQKVSLKNLRLSHDKYYAVTLDGKVTKTLYKDDLCLPSRALAVALAEDWDSQSERIDMKTLKLNQMMAKAVRTVHDPTLVAYMRNQI